MAFAALGAAAFLASQAPAPAAAAEPTVAVSAANAVVRAAESHLGASYRYGAIGPASFDCSGLVYHSFRQVGLGRRIGNLRSAQGLYSYFAHRHLASTTKPQVGDLVIWGGGSHVGIYVGNGRAISALVSGVRITRVSAVFPRFTTYLHTHLASTTVAAAKVVALSHRSTTSSKVRHVTNLAYLRTAPGTSHRRIAILHRDARLTVIGSRHLANHQHWLHVRTAGGRTGWVASWLVH
jgi:cell wall-associated NlpC family hydrolase